MCFHPELSEEDKKRIADEFKNKPSFETPMPPQRRIGSMASSKSLSSSSSSSTSRSYVKKRVVKDLFKKRQLSLRTIGINNPKEWNWDKYSKN